jgi:hypothetical protein
MIASYKFNRTFPSRDDLLTPSYLGERTYRRTLFSTRAGIIIHTSVRNCYRSLFIVAIDQSSRVESTFYVTFHSIGEQYKSLARWNINNFRHITVASEFIEFAVGAAWWNFARRIFACARQLLTPVYIAPRRMHCKSEYINTTVAGWLELALNYLAFVQRVIIQCFLASP